MTILLTLYLDYSIAEREYNSLGVNPSPEAKEAAKTKNRGTQTQSTTARNSRQKPKANSLNLNQKAVGRKKKSKKKEIMKRIEVENFNNFVSEIESTEDGKARARDLREKDKKGKQKIIINTVAEEAKATWELGKGVGLVASSEKTIIDRLVEIEDVSSISGVRDKETKMEMMSEFTCSAVWGDGKFEWACKNSDGRSGGILSVWNLEKRALWDRNTTVIHQNATCCICVAGDFNSIRRSSERVGRGVISSNRDVRGFDNFIRNTGLVDLPLHGKSFTCYNADGLSNSRLDRILLNNVWLTRWPNSHQRGLKFSISDHCPLTFEIKVKNWGPKPFRFLNSWLSHHDFKDFVTQKWKSYDVAGWNGFKLKEKFKFLKSDLKLWNEKVFGNLDKSIRITERRSVSLTLLMMQSGLKTVRYAGGSYGSPLERFETQR